MLTPEEKAAFAADEKMCESATPGEWRDCGHERGGCACHMIWSMGDDVCVAAAIEAKDETYTLGDGVSEMQARKNAGFIATSRDRWPIALAKIKDLEAENAALKDMLNQIASGKTHADLVRNAGSSLNAGGGWK